MGLFSQKRYLDGDRIDIGGAAVRLKVSGRARRVSLRLDAARGEIVATAPSPRRLAEAAAFAASRHSWITARLAELPKAAPFAPGSLIEVLGQPCRLVSAPGRSQWRPATDGGPLSRGRFRMAIIYFFLTLLADAMIAVLDPRLRAA